jgi:two-component system phosphate regulon sensor histidine kinase PhoR
LYRYCEERRFYVEGALTQRANGGSYMKNYIAKKLIAVIAAALLLFGVATVFVIENANKKSAESNAVNLLGVFATQMTDGNYKTADKYKILVQYSHDAKNIRVSVIDLDGKVLADTLSDDTEGFENHGSRPEITEAKGGGLGKNIRKSETDGIDYLYVARIVEVEETAVFLRISIPVNSINAYLFPIFSVMAVIFAAIIVLVFVLSKTLSAQIINPITLINKKLQTVGVKDLDNPIALTKYEEINEIITQIEDLSNRLDASIQSREAESNKNTFILESINQGIIAVDKRQNIIMMNQVAAEFLDCDVILPTNILNVVRNRSVVDALSRTLDDGQYQAFDMGLKESRLFEIRIMPVEYEYISAVMTISEVTDVRKLQLEKQEFFQNASHELNTPLTSILGYSEVLLKEKKYNPVFIETINREASRMRLLISDMLKIAELEGGTEEIVDEIIEFESVVIDVAASYEFTAAAKNIVIEKNLIKGAIKANEKKIREVVGNLLDNSLKYTQNGGKITLSLQKSREKIIFTISDDGIGIPRQYLNRVFERFFRVDKGRSKSEGGTGLGLSIVKHICNYYDAPISISSRVGGGTEISIAFRLVG